MTANFLSQYLITSIYLPIVLIIPIFIFKNQHKVVKRLAFFGFIVPLIIFSKIFIFYFHTSDFGVFGYKFISKMSFGLDNIGICFHFGVNGISMPFIMLTCIVSFIAGMYGIKTKTNNLYLYLSLLLLMQSGLIAAFSSINLFFIFIFHELTIIPTFLIMNIWGGRGRSVASIEMILYLSLGAIIILISITAIYIQSSSRTFDLIILRQEFNQYPLNNLINQYMAKLILFGFGIMISIWPLHSWVPRGYHASTLPLSIMHAGILKKFGIYSIIQIFIPLMSQGIIIWRTHLIWLSLGNIVIIGIIAMAQCDLKDMLSYNSIMHTGYNILSIVTLSTLGLSAALIMTFAHSISISLMFVLCNEIKNRSYSLGSIRSGGLAYKAPVLAFFFITASMCNIGLPGSVNFWGEFVFLTALWQFQPSLVVPVVFSIIISSVCGLRFISVIFFGSSISLQKNNKNQHLCYDLDSSTKINVSILVFFLLLIGLYPKILTEIINRQLVNYPPIGIDSNLYLY